MDDADFERLVLQHLDGQLDAPQVATLRGGLDSPERLRRYLELCRDATLLNELLSTKAAAPAASRARRRFSLARRAALWGLAAGLLGSVITVLASRWEPRPQVTPPLPAYVAELAVERGAWHSRAVMRASRNQASMPLRKAELVVRARASSDASGATRLRVVEVLAGRLPVFVANRSVAFDMTADVGRATAPTEGVAYLRQRDGGWSLLRWEQDSPRLRRYTAVWRALDAGRLDALVNLLAELDEPAREALAHRPASITGRALRRALDRAPDPTSMLASAGRLLDGWLGELRRPLETSDPVALVAACQTMPEELDGHRALLQLSASYRRAVRERVVFEVSKPDARLASVPLLIAGLAPPQQADRAVAGTHVVRAVAGSWSTHDGRPHRRFVISAVRGPALPMQPRPWLMISAPEARMLRSGESVWLRLRRDGASWSVLAFSRDELR